MVVMVGGWESCRRSVWSYILTFLFCWRDVFCFLLNQACYQGWWMKFQLCYKGDEWRVLVMGLVCFLQLLICWTNNELKDRLENIELQTKVNIAWITVIQCGRGISMHPVKLRCFCWICWLQFSRIDAKSIAPPDFLNVGPTMTKTYGVLSFGADVENQQRSAEFLPTYVDGSSIFFSLSILAEPFEPTSCASSTLFFPLSSLHWSLTWQKGVPEDWCQLVDSKPRA